MNHRGGRPPKPLSQKLVPATVSLRSERFDQFDKEARDRGVALSLVLREHLEKVSRIQNR
jgi:hypothetical protein